MKSISENPAQATIEFSDDQSSASLSGTHCLNVDLQNSQEKKFSVIGNNNTIFNVSDNETSEIFNIQSANGRNILSVNTGSTFDTISFCEDNLKVTDKVSILSGCVCNGDVLNDDLFNNTSDQFIDGEFTFNDDTTLISTNNTAENQSRESDSHIITRVNSIYDDIFRSFTLHRADATISGNYLRRGGIQNAFTGGVSLSVEGANGDAIAILQFAANFATYTGSGATLSYQNHRFLFSSVYGFNINRSSKAYFRVYIGIAFGESLNTSNGPVRFVPFAGEDPLPPRTRSIGFEVRCTETGDRQIRLFSRDGYGLQSTTTFSDGDLILSNWVTFSDDSKNNDLTHVIVEFGLDNAVRLYLNNMDSNSRRERTSSVPIAELSGPGVPIDGLGVYVNWSYITAVVIDDGITPSNRDNQRFTLRDNIIQFL